MYEFLSCGAFTLDLLHDLFSSFFSDAGQMSSLLEDVGEHILLPRDRCKQYSGCGILFINEINIYKQNSNTNERHPSQPRRSLQIGRCNWRRFIWTSLQGNSSGYSIASGHQDCTQCRGCAIIQEGDTNTEGVQMR
jgi:hypothetical protein